MSEKSLFDLQREASELRVRLAHLEAVIRRKEHELWHAYQNERFGALQAMDQRSESSSLLDAIFGRATSPASRRRPEPPHSQGT